MARRLRLARRPPGGRQVGDRALTAQPAAVPPASTLVSIQVLRGLAALGVVVFHAGQQLGDPFWVGAAGVDVFFVISGVIIWRVATTTEAKPGPFAWRRFTRIAPAYWIATAAAVALAALWPAALPEVSVSTKRLALSMAFIPHHNPAGQVFPVLPPGWTLDYEAAFYAIVALALLAPVAWRFGLVAAALTTIGLAGFLDPPRYELGANPLMLEFAAGAWLAHRSPAISPRFGLGLIAAGVVLLVAQTLLGLRSDLFRPALWGVPAILIAGGALAAEPIIARRAPPAFVRLGDASYAIYLCHYLAVGVVAQLLPSGALFLITAILASIAAGFAFHHAVERPLIAALRALPRRLAPRPPRAAAT